MFDSKKFKCALSFFTIIPSKCDNINSGYSGYVSLVGAIIGLISGAAFYFVSFYVNVILGAAISLSLILLLSGFNHLDAVLDAGDAILVRGPPSRKLEVLKDHFLGAGGFGFAFVIYVVTFSSIASLIPLEGMITIFLSEIIAKDSYILNSLKTKDMVPGGVFSQFKISVQQNWRLQILVNFSFFILLAVIFLPSLLIAAILSLVMQYFIKTRIERSFEGINGDVLGFLGEITRTFFIFIAVILFLFEPLHFIPLAFLLSHI
ncbi:MAG: adenosylcobinamide-GDP ribazoletransferase [Candidatus Thermoplasmatota archaeon]|nr:adenosylcobinamide-GDP ribazoletransferase [Candidatus Thermoplasmatota archaeon]